MKKLKSNFFSNCKMRNMDTKKTDCFWYSWQGLNADLSASLVLKSREIKHIRSETFSQEKTRRKTICARRTKKAQESASSGCGDYVRHACTDATINDALNSQQIESV